MRHLILLMVCGLFLSSGSARGQAAVLRVLPGELTAEQILDGQYPFPPSPVCQVSEVWDGLNKERLGRTPAPGIHPRILLSPDELPDLRRRLKDTETGRALFKRLGQRIDETICKSDGYHAQFYTLLSKEDIPGAEALLRQHKGLPGTVGHYQFYLYTHVMESFYAMVTEDALRGKQAATATATYARLIEPIIDHIQSQPLSDDTWRVRVSSELDSWAAGQNMRDITGYHLLGYAYDFGFPYMTDQQREVTRRVIAKATRGKIWTGASLPHHWRNWNWVMVAMGQPLLALSIEGEDGYDPRIYKLAVDICRDYLTWGISPGGCSTEAVGYTQFGLVWSTPFFVAASRRGDNLLVHSHHRAMIDWYLQSMEPYAPILTQLREGDDEQIERSLPGKSWTSHGDGGDEGPSIWHMMMWKYFFPEDPKIDFIWQVLSSRQGFFDGNFHIIEPLIWATDGRKDKDGKPVQYSSGANLNLPKTWFDPVRSSLNSRSDWSIDAAAMQFECRSDSTGPSHEHADRGNFTFTALGRQWARESFRSIESRHHNVVLVDGMGQGFWPGPGRWIGLQDSDWAVIAVCDAKAGYDWWWPKTLVTDPPDSVRFQFPRWSDYSGKAKEFRQRYGQGPYQRDMRPSVVEHFKGYEATDPRMWDEDGWPVRLAHNPVQRAFRTVVFVRSPRPYLLVVDDIQKDDQERLYEWIMMTGLNTDAADIKNKDILLCDATANRDSNGLPRPRKGDRQLLVRVADMNDPAKVHDFQSRPSFRLETFEKKDTLEGYRSFGRDRRLVIASRSVTPNFKILLFPHRVGEPLPETVWNEARNQLQVKIGGVEDIYDFRKSQDGRTAVVLNRSGEKRLEIKEQTH